MSLGLVLGADTFLGLAAGSPDVDATNLEAEPFFKEVVVVDLNEFLGLEEERLLVLIELGIGAEGQSRAQWPGRPHL